MRIRLTQIRYVLDKRRCILTVSKLVSLELNVWPKSLTIGMFQLRNFLLSTEEDYQM